jgi:hypothetical protein
MSRLALFSLISGLSVLTYSAEAVAACPDSLPDRPSPEVLRECFNEISVLRKSIETLSATLSQTKDERRALTVGKCSKSYNVVPNEYPFNVSFDARDCEEIVAKMNISAGFLSRSHICGGIDNFDIHLNPKGVTFYGRTLQNCSSHPSDVTVIYLGTRND